MVKNVPCNAENVGSILGQGTKIPQAVEQLSPCATASEPTGHNDSLWAANERATGHSDDPACFSEDLMQPNI